MGKTTRLNVELTATDKTKGVFSKTAKNMEQFNKKTGKMGVISTKTSKTVKDLGNGYEKIRITTKKTNAEGRKQVAVQESIAKTHQKFNMNALGVMFAGMAMQRTFSNLNKTAREWVGMNELMGTAMGVVMLPATMDLLEFGVLPLFDALTSLPEPAQKAIGYTSLALEGLGGVIMTGGQLMLGLGAFEGLFPVAFAKVAATAGFVTSLSGALVIFGVTVAALAIGSWINSLAEYSEAWNELGESIETTMDILGQKGQETRTIAPPKLSEEDSLMVDKGTQELLDEKGVLPRTYGPIQQKQLPTLPGPLLEPLPSEKQPKTGFAGIIDWLTGTDSMAVGGKVRSTGSYYLHEGEEV
ncbi:MAG: hypothetical protein DRJ35_08470, partial [Thermoprotei archaeon]